MPNLDTFKQKVKLLGINLDNYPNDAITFIYDNFCFFEQDFSITPDIILQIKSKLGIIQEENDIYIKFIDHLAQNNILHGNILEVGSGFYPTLAQKLMQIETVDNVTAMDPNLTIINDPQLKLIKADFASNTDISKYDSIIGFKPCAATLPIIQAANSQKRPFSIVLCECTHFQNPYLYMPISIEKWRDYVWNTANETLDSGAILKESFLEFPKHYTLTKTYQKSK